MNGSTSLATDPRWLRPDVIAEPLINQWYAWSYLLPPASAARYLTESQLAVMASFVEAPQVHVAALRDPAMLGGPFIAYGPERQPEVAELLARTRREQGALITLSAAIARLEQLLAAHPRGESMDGLYERLPAALRGYVELVADARHQPSARFHEGLLYRSAYWRPQNQAVALRRLPDPDRRAFVMSTPRLAADVDLLLQRPFADPAWDRLFSARRQPLDAAARAGLAQALGLDQADEASRARFEALFTATPPRPAPRWTGPGLRVRYLGHACVLVETPHCSVLVDPLVAYDKTNPDDAQGPGAVPRYSLADLPEHIDFALITHNHQDHVMLETLLQLRHRIGTVLVPAGQRGALIDPSLRLALQQIGFERVQELDRLQELPLPGGGLLRSLPVLGEHGDLDIATKTAWWIAAEGRSLLCAADSNNLDSALYEHVARLCGPLDLLFIGMECEGAPFTWAYGPLLPVAVPHAQAQARRLNGSDAARGWGLVERLKPAQVAVYAMGLEPWLNYITSIHYEADSMAIVESDKLIARCRAAGTPAQRLMGRAEFVLAPQQRRAPEATPLPALTEVPQDEREPLTKALSRTGPNPPSQPAEPGIHAATPPPPDELGALLTELQQAQVQLRVAEGKLRVNAPQGALTPALTARLQAHKPALLALLGAARPAATAADTAPAQAAVPAASPARIEPLPADALLPAGQLFRSAPAAPPRAVLVTGATGFIGSHLLHQLLVQTDAQLHCLLRLPAHESADADADAQAQGHQRLRQALQAIGHWQPGWAARLHPVPGDLGLPRFGLSDLGWQTLARDIDTVWHNGAQVHHLLPYAQLHAANVGGTLTALALCAQGRAKTLHHVSSLSVLPPLAQAAGRRFMEAETTAETLADIPAPVGGYNRSKWVAEHLVHQAMARGLAASIYRPGPISGDARSGHFNANDFLVRLMRGYLQSGLAPQGSLPLDLLPVDWLARAMVYLGGLPAARGGVLHLLHPQPVSSDRLFDACLAAGHRVRRVPYAEWFAELQRVAREAPDHPLYPLVALFGARAGQAPSPNNGASAAPASAAHASPYDTTRLRRLLADAPFSLPALDATLFATYLGAMQAAGLLPEPAAAPTEGALR